MYKTEKREAYKVSLFFVLLAIYSTELKLRVMNILTVRK